MQRIGLQDTPASRLYMERWLNKVLNDAKNIVEVGKNGRTVREALLAGPLGVLKVETVWDGAKLITIKLLGK